MAENWWEEEGVLRPVDPKPPEGSAEGLPAWALEPGALRGGPRGMSLFRTDPELTPEVLAELPEMTHSSRMIEGFATPGGEEDTSFLGTLGGMGRRMGTEAMQAWLQMTTTDPVELGMMLQNEFPDLIEVRTSPPTEENPHGVLVAKNKATGYEAVINRPGFSGMDVLQTIGLVGQYTPAAKLTAPIRHMGQRMLVGAGLSGATEYGAQRLQEAYGGEFDPEDIAMATAFGGAGEALGPALIAGGRRIREYFKPIQEIDAIPANIRQALQYADDMAEASGKTGPKISTSDALQEFLTPTMRIFFRVADRIPGFGTAAMRRKQIASRADALQNVANRFDIDIETDMGEEIVESWLERLRKQRWWGANERYAEPGAATYDMMERAFAREADAAIDDAIRAKINKLEPGINEFHQVADIAEMIFRGGRARQAAELMRNLTPQGQQAMRQEFLRRGLMAASFEEGAQATVPRPGAFVNYLKQNRALVTEMFGEQDRQLLDGLASYIRITDDAAKFSEGAGMISAGMTGTAGVLILDMAGTMLAGAGTGLLAKSVQSNAVRNLLLKLVHVQGNKAAEKAIVDRIRPLANAMWTQYFQDRGDMPALFMGEGFGDQDQAGAGLAGAMMQLGTAAAQQVGRVPTAVMDWLGDEPEEPVQ